MRVGSGGKSRRTLSVASLGGRFVVHEPQASRLAAMVPDHPADDVDFEGTVPASECGKLAFDAYADPGCALTSELTPARVRRLAQGTPPCQTA